MKQVYNGLENRLSRIVIFTAFRHPSFSLLKEFPEFIKRFCINWWINVFNESYFIWIPTGFYKSWNTMQRSIQMIHARWYWVGKITFNQTPSLFPTVFFYRSNIPMIVSISDCVIENNLIFPVSTSRLPILIRQENTSPSWWQIAMSWWHHAF